MKKIINTFLAITLFIFTTSFAFSEESSAKLKASDFNRAIKKGDVEKVKIYLDEGFDPNEKYWLTSLNYGMPFIGTAIANNRNEIFDLLLEYGANVNINGVNQPLSKAIEKNNTYMVERLIKEGADLNAEYMGFTVGAYGIAKAIKTKNNTLLDILLDNDVNPNSSFAVPLLQEAIVENNPYAIKKLIENGADLEKKYMGYQAQAFAFDLAIHKKNNDLLDFLLDNDADPNVKFNVPILHLAVLERNKYAVEKLIENGADLNKTYLRLNAKQMAESKKYKEIVEVFPN